MIYLHLSVRPARPPEAPMGRRPAPRWPNEKTKNDNNTSNDNNDNNSNTSNNHVSEAPTGRRPAPRWRPRAGAWPRPEI